MRFFKRHKVFLEKCKNVVAISLVLNQAKQAGSCLVIRRAFLADENGVLNVEAGRALFLIIMFVINEHDQRVAKSVNLLPGTFERARRLRLADARNFDVHAEFGKINPFGRTASCVGVATLEQRLEFVFEISADSLAIRHAK